MFTASPFPGMDPWLEAFWDSVHHRLVTAVCDQIGVRLPAGLVADVEVGVYVLEAGDDRGRPKPDVSLVRAPGAPPGVLAGASAAVATPPYLVTVPAEPVRQARVVVRSLVKDEPLVTAVELISPTNKRKRLGREAYVAKRAAFRAAGANVVEVDFVRGGGHLIDVPLDDVPARTADALQGVRPAGGGCRRVARRRAGPDRGRVLPDAPPRPPASGRRAAAGDRSRRRAGPPAVRRRRLHRGRPVRGANRLRRAARPATVGRRRRLGGRADRGRPAGVGEVSLRADRQPTRISGGPVAITHGRWQWRGLMSVGKRALNVAAWSAVLLLCGVAAGCGIRPVPMTTLLVDSPAGSDTRTVEVGGAVLDKGVVITRASLILDEPVTASRFDGLFKERYTVQPGTLFARDESDAERFYYAARVDTFNGLFDSDEPGGIKVSRDGERWAIFVRENARFFPITPPTGFHPAEVDVPGQPGYRRQLIYNGRSGSIVSFIYRQSSQDGAHPTFVAAVHYDLTASDSLDVQGARIRVVRCHANDAEVRRPPATSGLVLNRVRSAAASRDIGVTVWADQSTPSRETRRAVDGPVSPSGASDRTRIARLKRR